MNETTDGGGIAGMHGGVEQARKDYGEARKLRDQEPFKTFGISQRPAVTREDLIDMSLKLQEALSLITQALTRMR